MKIRLIIVVLFFQFFSTACDDGTSVVATNTFGSLLNGIFDRANQLIQQAQTTGLILEVNGGAQVQNLIITARDSYKDDLNVTVNAMSAQQQQVVSELDGLLNKVQSGVSDLTADLTQIALILPFSNKFPQLTKYKGTIIPPNQKSSTIVQINGVFADVGASGYEATIKLGKKLFKCISKTDQEIKFSIPDSEFKLLPSKIDYKPFEVQVDYKKRGWLFNSKATAVFNLFFVLLPNTFGTYSLELTQTVDTTLFEEKVCGPFAWNTHSGQDDGVPKGCSMESGWICDVNSVHPIWHPAKEEGRMNVDWFDRGNASSPTAAMWNYLATTRHGWTGNYGGLEIDIAYKRFKTTQVTQTIKGLEQSLNWGDSKVITFDPKAQWKLIFHQFDGKTKEIASSDQVSPYLKVSTSGNHIEIKLAPFDL